MPEHAAREAAEAVLQTAVRQERKPRRLKHQKVPSSWFFVLGGGFVILVTGGAGLIGSAVVRRLNELGRDDIIVVDHLGTSEKWKHLSELRFFDYYEKEVFLEKVARNQVPDEIEAIVHLGACSSTTEKDASYLIANNFEYSKQLALFALTRGIRFVYASSAATYGDGAHGFSDDEANLPMLRPLNIYGYSKHLFDLWALRAGLLDRIAGLKYFNVFGPNEYHKGEMRSLILKAYEQICTTGYLRLFRSYRPEYADGEQVRDFLYVKDAADMTVHFMNNSAANGVFNIGSGTTTSWNSLAAAIFAALDMTVRIEYIDMPENIRDKYQYYTCADLTKLRNCGYTKIITPLDESVAEYLRGYLATGHRIGDQHACE